jgi:hypothetical protein
MLRISVILSCFTFGVISHLDEHAFVGLELCESVFSSDLCKQFVVCTGTLFHTVQVSQEAVNPFAFVFETLRRIALQWRIGVRDFALYEGNGHVVLEDLEEG